MRKPAVAVLMLVLLLCCAASAFAAPRPPAPKTWYVSATTGNDKNAGTVTRPFRTLAKAIASASKTTSDLIRVATGNYPETLSVAGFNGLTVQGGWSTNFKTFDPAAYPTTLLGSGAAGSVGFDVRNSFGVVLASLEITGYDQGVFTSNTDYNALNLTVARCRLYGNGIGIHFMNSNVDVKGNLISDSTYGIYTPPSPSPYDGIHDFIVMDISGNVLSGHSEAGICLQGVAPDVARRKVTNNILHGNLNENIFIRSAMVNTMNNTITGGVYGIHVETASIFSMYGDIGNNIVANVSGAAIYAGWNVSLGLSNNAFHNNALDYQGNAGPQPTDLLADPLLDPATYRLTAGSPCIDAGVPSFYDWYFGDVVAPDSDIDGNPRSAALGGDGLYDIGADEFVQ